MNESLLIKAYKTRFGQPPSCVTSLRFHFIYYIYIVFIRWYKGDAPPSSNEYIYSLLRHEVTITPGIKKKSTNFHDQISYPFILYVRTNMNDIVLSLNVTSCRDLLIVDSLNERRNPYEFFYGY